MAISKCISLSSDNKAENGGSERFFRINETGCHGTSDFPAAVYLDDVTNGQVSWHWHEEFEMGFVTEGSAAVWCGDRKYLLDRGDAFFINSNILHSMYNAEEGNKAVFKSIVFSGSIIGGSINSVFYTKYLLPILNSGSFKDCIIRRENGAHKKTLSLLSDIWDAIYFEPDGYEIAVRNKLSEMFCILLSSQKSETSRADKKARNFLREERVRILLDHIHTHYSERITLDDLAKAAFISKTEVLRCFRAITGQTPINYLRAYRLQRAAYMLGNENKNIAQIGEECGFDDSSYFISAFKAMYHCTPHSYRTKNKT